MKKLMFAALCLALSACAAHQVAGTGFMSGKPAEFKVREYTENGVLLDGWMLIINGEEMGILRFDGKPTGPVSRTTVEFKPLTTKYGVFDMVLVKNLNLAGTTDTFTITLDGEYVATVSGTV